MASGLAAGDRVGLYDAECQCRATILLEMTSLRLPSRFILQKLHDIHRPAHDPDPGALERRQLFLRGARRIPR